MENYSEYFIRNNYTNEFKIKICKEHISTGSPIRSLAKKYKLSSHSLIHDWLRRFKFVNDKTNRVLKSNFAEALNNENMSKLESKNSEVEFEKLQLEKRIVELEKQLKEAEMKAIAYSTMVDIAEKELKIPIRKKYNTKP